MRPELARDPYLRPLVERWGETAAFEAGFFVDDDPTDAPLGDVGWLCTPTSVVVDGLAVAAAAGRLGDGVRPVVLLSTGAFFPLHHGHLAMLDSARQALEHDGAVVVGGYLSPGHDAYLRHKCGSVPVTTSARLAAVDAGVAEAGAADRLAVDPWEAQARAVAVNFTDVTARLQAYLRAHLRADIDVVYVAGGDNARFALAFTERGGCVVVGRPGHEAEVDRWRSDPRVAGHPRIRFVAGTVDAASSAIRRTGAPTVGPATGTRATTGPGRLALRLEDLGSARGLGLSDADWSTFQEGLRSELAALVPVDAVAVADQGPATVDGTISLDPLLPGEIQLGISRRYDLGGRVLLGHVARPGWPSLADQVAAVPAGRWRLRDDDVATGGTVAFVRSLLPSAVTVVATEVALAPAVGEIADSRDFLLGADEGGLVVALPDGTTGRAPYLLPYVDPEVRIGLAPGTGPGFSIAVWNRMADLFGTTDLRVADLPAPAAATVRAAGWGPDDALADVCAHHARTLRRVVGTTVAAATAAGTASTEASSDSPPGAGSGQAGGRASSRRQ